MENYSKIKSSISQIINKYVEELKDYSSNYFFNTKKESVKSKKLDELKKSFEQDLLVLLEAISNKDCSTFIEDSKKNFVLTVINGLSEVAKAQPDFALEILKNCGPLQFEASKSIIEGIVKSVKESNLSKDQKDELLKEVSQLSNFEKKFSENIKKMEVFLAYRKKQDQKDEFFNELCDLKDTRKCRKFTKEEENRFDELERRITYLNYELSDESGNAYKVFSEVKEFISKLEELKSEEEWS